MGKGFTGADRLMIILELSEEKTDITHIDDGFDMLGWTLRKFKGKLIVKPSKKALKVLKRAK